MAVEAGCMRSSAAAAHMGLEQSSGALMVMTSAAVLLAGVEESA